MQVNSVALRALDGRADLALFGDNRLLLFALELGLRLEDVHTVASVALTDGRDDKKCDLVYVDRDSGRAIIAQGYMSRKLNRKAAPANKGSDLNTAVSWLLGDSSRSIPPGLESAATELRTAVDDGFVESIELWYTHNLPESKAVQVELVRAA